MPNRKTALLATVALSVIAHALMLAVPSVNSEFAFADAAKYFLTHERILIDEYFSMQANTVALPFLTAGASRLLPGVPLLVLMRAFSLVGLVMLSVGMYRICAVLGRDDTRYVIALLLLNPLVWIYSGRATVDFLPVAVGVFALGIVLQDYLSIGRALLGGMVFGAAVVLKYHAVMLLLPVAALYLSGRVRMPAPAVAASFLLPVAILPVAFVLKVHDVFGFWITPPEFQTKHQIGFAGWLSNFVCYAGYLTLLAMPTALLLPELRAYLRQRWRVFAPLVMVLALVGLFAVADNGEMNLGPLDAWVPGELRTGVFSVIALGLLIPLLAMRIYDGDSTRVATAVWVACLTIILALSLTRPAQRYLLFVLPFFLLTLPARVLSDRRFHVPALVLFCLGNGFVEYSRWCTGVASDRMLSEIQRRGLLAVTDPGAIWPHAGGEFYRTPRARSLYTVVAGDVPGAIVVAQAGAPALTKYYSLIEAQSAP